MNKRIACYGFVEKGRGSINGAHFLILEELLKRGYEIDFYGRKNFSYPQELCQHENFRLINLKKNSIKRLIDVFLHPLSFKSRKDINVIINSLFMNKLNNRSISRKIIANHQIKKYNLCMFLGHYSQLDIKDIPIISWAQGPPSQVQWEIIQKLRNKIIALCGSLLYFKIKIFYMLKSKTVEPVINNSSVLICGSKWTKDKIIAYGIERKLVKNLPYPVDINYFNLNAFDTTNRQSGTDKKIFLWLGRSEPRKRLDLLLDAYEMVLQERQDVLLKIVGGFSWAPGYKKLIDRFQFPDYIEYQPHIERAKIPNLMANCDVLIQPSESENFGTSVAESLCCGLPVIVGPTNGTKDYISSSSFIFEKYTPESLKKTMLQAIKTIEKNREDLALDARKTAENNFDVFNVVNSLEDIFHKSLNLYQLTSLK